MKSIPLFPELTKRIRPNRKLMYPYDGAEINGKLHASFYCRHCRYESEWLEIESVAKSKRGLPCPKCNKQTTQGR